MKRFSLILAFSVAVLCGNLSAIDLQDDSTILSILQSSAGQTVELRLRSGEKMGGKLDKTTDKVAHLTQLTGAEFFEAFVDVKDILAVVVRTKTK